MARPRFQFSLLRLLVATAVIGGVLACFVNFGLSAVSLTIVWTALLIGLTLAPLLAWLGNESRRPFYVGIAWFGWVYLLLLWAGRLPHDGPSAVGTQHVVRLPVLAIDLGMRTLYEWMLPPESRTWSDDPGSDFSTLRSMYDAKLVGPGTFPPGGFGVGGGAGGGFGGAPGFGGALAFGGMPAGGMPIPMAAAVPTAPQTRRLVIPWELFRDFAHALWASLWALLGGIIAWRMSRRVRAASSDGR